MIYASSAAVYGGSEVFKSLENERPLNVYGYSKFCLISISGDIRQIFKVRVVGLRYFNVYGPRKRTKAAWPAWRFI